MSEAAAALAVVMPGTTRTGTPASPAGRHLLAGAAENGRISAFEANDTFTGQCEIDHQGIDIFLAARCTMPLLSNMDPAGFATRKLKNGGSDEAIVDDDVGSLKLAHRLQSEKLGVAWPRSNDDDLAGHWPVRSFATSVMGEVA